MTYPPGPYEGSPEWQGQQPDWQGQQPGPQGSNRVGRASSRVGKASNRVGRASSRVGKASSNPTTTSSGRFFPPSFAASRSALCRSSTPPRYPGYGFRDSTLRRRLQPTTRRSGPSSGQSSARRLRDFHSDLVRSIRGGGRERSPLHNHHHILELLTVRVDLPRPPVPRPMRYRRQWYGRTTPDKPCASGRSGV